MPYTWGLARTTEGFSAHGEVDLAAAQAFEAQATAAVMEASGPIALIDLSRVTFMDSSGITALIRILELRSGKTYIVQPSRQVFMILELVALTEGVLPNVEIRQPFPD
jgi:anti-anti-sigma factor